MKSEDSVSCDEAEYSLTDGIWSVGLFIRFYLKWQRSVAGIAEASYQRFF